jgi:hypothetical protein
VQKVSSNLHLKRDAEAALAATKSKAKPNGKPNGKPVKGRGQLANKVRTWLVDNPDGTRSQFVATTKVKVSSPFFSTLKRESKKQPGTNGEAKEARRSIGMVGKLKKAEAENDFLKWWVSGERKGWVDRLLKESQ